MSTMYRRRGTVQNLDAYFAMQNRPKKEEAKPQAEKDSKTSQGGKCGKIAAENSEATGQSSETTAAVQTDKITGPGAERKPAPRPQQQTQAAKTGHNKLQDRNRFEAAKNVSLNAKPKAAKPQPKRRQGRSSRSIPFMRRKWQKIPRRMKRWFGM